MTVVMPTDYTARATALLADATLAEKVGMMSGKGFFKAYAEDAGRWGARPYRAGSGIERLGIEPLYFTDGPRGVARGNSTCFPCVMARGASFDVDLERRIGEAMGVEIRAQGCTLSGAVCINLLRHSAWGRAQETYGEDPYHLGAMGAALGTGIQAHNVIATVKHFALNSMENARFTVDVRVDERTLHEVYLPHFKACIDAGVASKLGTGHADAFGELARLPPAVEQGRAAARHHNSGINHAPTVGVAHRDADPVALLHAVICHQPHRYRTRGTIKLLEAQSLAAFDQKGCIAVHMAEIGHIVGNIAGRIGDEGQVAAVTLGRAQCDHPAGAGDDVVSGLQAQVERRRHSHLSSWSLHPAPLWGGPSRGRKRENLCHFFPC